MQKLRALVSRAAPDDARDVGAVVADDDGGALAAMSAYFGAADERQAVRVIVGGEDLGYITRDQALDLLDAQSRDLGQSSGWTLPGVSAYQTIEVRCPVKGCPANPIYAANFDTTYPPDCPVHPGHALTLVQA
jgi:hypothetical protein